MIGSRKTKIRTFAFLSFVAFSFSGCTTYLPRHPLGADALPTGFYGDPTRPALALLEYRIGKYLAEDRRPYQTICAVAMQFDRSNPASLPSPLDPSVERKLLARFPQLSPSGECKRDGLAYVDEATGTPAAVFDVHDLDCVNPANCSAWGGYYAYGVHGWGFYELKWHRSGWAIRAKDLGIVLTGHDD